MRKKGFHNVVGLELPPLTPFPPPPAAAAPAAVAPSRPRLDSASIGSIAGAISDAVSTLGVAAIGLADKEGLQGDVKAICGRRPVGWGSRGKEKLDQYLACVNQAGTRIKDQQAQVEMERIKAANKMSPLQITMLVGGGIMLTGLLVLAAVRIMR